MSVRLSGSAEDASTRASTATASATQVFEDIHTLAVAGEEMSASIAEIARNAGEALRVASEGVAMAERTNETMSRLGESSAAIGNVVKLITSIAGQTNLLALNAMPGRGRSGVAGPCRRAPGRSSPRPRLGSAGPGGAGRAATPGAFEVGQVVSHGVSAFTPARTRRPPAGRRTTAGVGRAPSAGGRPEPPPGLP